MAGRNPGTPKSGGRQAGTPNKITASIKAGILAAYEQAGGEAYLLNIANTDPRTFCGLLAKILPTQIEAPEPTETHLVVSWLNEIDGKSRGLPCMAAGPDAEEL